MKETAFIPYPSIMKILQKLGLEVKSSTMEVIPYGFVCDAFLDGLPAHNGRSGFVRVALHARTLTISCTSACAAFSNLALTAGRHFDVTYGSDRAIVITLVDQD